VADYCPITVARFWSKVEVVRHASHCWPWRGNMKSDGYGHFKIKGKFKIAHRVAWEIVNGEPLGDRHCLHACDNPACCNPHHLRAGTAADNIADMWSRGRQRFASLAGERNPRALLTQADVDRIRARLADGETNRAVAADYPVSEGMVSRIKLGLSWRGSEQQRNEKGETVGKTAH